MDEQFKELLHKERLAALGRLAAGVAHEIGNPVTGIACLAQNLEYDSDSEEVREVAREIIKQTERVTRIVDSLVHFSHLGNHCGTSELRPCNVADCVDEAVHLLSLDQSARRVTFENRCDRELLVEGNSPQLLQVFVNLLSNAREASREGDSVRISATTEPPWARITVSDDGCGVPAALQREVFEPFVTTKDPGKGTGLGLALVYRIVTDLGGDIAITSPLHGDGSGTAVSVRLSLGSYDSAFTDGA